MKARAPTPWFEQPTGRTTPLHREKGLARLRHRDRRLRQAPSLCQDFSARKATSICLHWPRFEAYDSTIIET